MVSLLHAPDKQIDAGCAGLGGQFGCQEHRRTERRERRADRQRADDDAAAGFVLEAIDKAPAVRQWRRASDERSTARRRRLVEAAPGEARPRTGRDRCPRETVRAAALHESAASSATRRPVRDTGRSSAGSLDAGVSLVHPSVSLLEVQQLDDETSAPPRRAPFSSGRSTALASATPGRIGRPPTCALQMVEPAGSVAFRKLRWLLRTAYRASTRSRPSSDASAR